MSSRSVVVLLWCASVSSLRIADHDVSDERTCSEEHAIPGLKVYYVNEARQAGRKDCIHKQLSRQCLKGERFEAISFDSLPHGFTGNHPYKDCFQGGIDFARIVEHGTGSIFQGDFNLWQKGGRILANWCSHYRLLKKAKEEQDNGAYDYLLMLEDDVVLDHEKFVPILKDFLANYTASNWDLVQLDAFGPNGMLERKDELEKGYVREAVMESFRGKEMYMPNKGDGFWGFQAVLVRTASLENIIEKMSKMPVVPYDWLHKRINDDHFKGLKALTFQAGITRNPEQFFMKDAGVVEPIKKPDYCDDSILESTIA